MSIFELLRSDGHMIVNKKLAHALGLHEAIILSELISWFMFYSNKGQLDEENMFFVTVDKLQENTTLSKHQQSKAINNLVERGLISYRQKGLPAKRYFSVHKDAIESLFVDTKKLKNLTTDNNAVSKPSTPEKPRHNQKLKNLTTGGQKIEQLEVKKLNTINALDTNHNLQDLIDRLIDSESLREFLNKTQDLKPEHVEAIAEINQVYITHPGFTESLLIEKITACLKTYKRSFKACLRKSIENELNKPTKPVKQRSKAKKPAIPIVQPAVQQAELTDEELQRIMAKARKLDEKFK